METHQTCLRGLLTSASKSQGNLLTHLHKGNIFGYEASLKGESSLNDNLIPDFRLRKTHSYKLFVKTIFREAAHNCRGFYGISDYQNSPMDLESIPIVILTLCQNMLSTNTVSQAAHMETYGSPSQRSPP